MYTYAQVEDAEVDMAHWQAQQLAEFVAGTSV